MKEKNLMMNKKPIFIVGFQRGGTGILLNLLLSHPSVCKPRGETHEVFKGRRKILPVEPWSAYVSKLWRYLPVLISQRQDIFSIDLWESRRELSQESMKRVDQILFEEKLKALSPAGNLYKAENLKYSPEEIRNSRLLCKNINGLIFATGMFCQMYPDATFIALVRNGFALCEGHIRRGTPAIEAARLYERGTQKIILDCAKLDNYYVFRYEDIVNEPRRTLERIYQACNLSIEKIDKIRFITTKVITADGEHEYVHLESKERLIWYDLEDFGNFFHPKVNRNQLARLTEEQKRVISEYAYRSLEYFSYDQTE